MGSALLRLLKNTDAQIRALLLPGEKGTVEAENIQYIHGNVCRPDTLEALFAGEPVQEVIVIHAAGIISISKQVSPLVREVNVKGTQNMIALGLKHSVDRFVYVSSVHAIPELPAGRKIRETKRFSPDSVVGCYAKTKAEAAAAVLDAVKDGLPAVIVHPSGIIGPYDRGNNHLIQLIYDYMKGRIPVCVKGGYDFVDVRDVARGCLLAAAKGRTGQCYILSGAYASVYDLLACAGKYCGKKPLPAIPLSLARAAAPVIEAVARRRGKRPLYTAYSLHAVASNSNFSNKKAADELGYKARPLEETVRDTVAWYKRHAV